MIKKSNKNKIKKKIVYKFNFVCKIYEILFIKQAHKIMMKKIPKKMGKKQKLK